VKDEAFLNEVLQDPRTAVDNAELDISDKEVDLLVSMAAGHAYKVTWPDLLNGLHNLHASRAWGVAGWKILPKFEQE
jgi:hypothetical protein